MYFLESYMEEELTLDQQMLIFEAAGREIDYKYEQVLREHELRLAEIDACIMIESADEDTMVDYYSKELQVFHEATGGIIESIIAWLKGIWDALLGRTSKFTNEAIANASGDELELPHDPGVIKNIASKVVSTVRNLFRFKKDDGTYDTPKILAAIGLAAGGTALGVGAFGNKKKIKKGDIEKTKSELNDIKKDTEEAAKSLPKDDQGEKKEKKKDKDKNKDDKNAETKENKPEPKKDTGIIGTIRKILSSITTAVSNVIRAIENFLGMRDDGERKVDEAIQGAKDHMSAEHQAKEDEKKAAKKEEKRAKKREELAAKKEANQKKVKGAIVDAKEEMSEQSKKEKEEAAKNPKKPTKDNNAEKDAAMQSKKKAVKADLLRYAKNLGIWNKGKSSNLKYSDMERIYFEIDKKKGEGKLKKISKEDMDKWMDVLDWMDANGITEGTIVEDGFEYMLEFVYDEYEIDQPTYESTLEELGITKDTLEFLESEESMVGLDALTELADLL